MSKIDFTLHNIPLLLTRNKSKQWQEDIIQSSTALLNFLKNNEVIFVSEPFDDEG